MPYMTMQGNVECDGMLIRRLQVQVVFEFKSQVGNAGDPDFQALDHFLRACQLYTAAVQYRHCALVVCLLGPRLEVWAATREGGKVWAQPVAESKCYGPDEYLLSTAKIWPGIRLFVQEHHRPQRLVSPPIPWPLCEESSVQCLEQGKLVFLCDRGDGKTEVAKMVKRYSVEAHLAWMPFAPEFRGVDEACDTFRVVRMEYLSAEQGWLPGDQIVKKIRQGRRHVAKLAACIGVAMEAGHSRGFVHGDLRLCNIMVRHSDELEEDGYPKYEVKFLDFDWSGKHGQVVYPLMNDKISWPPGAEYGVQISKDHDIYFQTHLLEQINSTNLLLN